MRRVLIVGANSSLAVRLAAELAREDVQVIVAEGRETAKAAAEAMGVLDVETNSAIDDAFETAENQVVRVPEDVYVMGSGRRLSLAMQAMALELSRYELAEPTIEPYMLPRSQQAHPYWQQGTPDFHRKQQSMRAKARRR